MLKVMTIVGTRPEIIRLSRVIPALEACTKHILVHTGQNYDRGLSGIFFDELQLRAPDHWLKVDTSSLGATLGGILEKSESVLREEKPDAVLILGDTNSALAAIMARRMKIPVYHMEAGNRCFDFNVPEEINRRIVDHVADFNLVYTEHARRHLLSEGLPHRRIYLTGSPMREVLEHYRPVIAASDVLPRLGIEARKYFVISLHREENVDGRAQLTELVQALNALAEEYNLPVIVSTHPRTRKRLDSAGLAVESKVRFLEPLGFPDYVHLQQHALCTVSDSGTIGEESAILGFPAVTPRRAIERPEALDAGTLLMASPDADGISRGVRAAIARFSAGMGPVPGWTIPADYQIGDVSQRVANLILGTATLSNEWDGIRRHDSN